MRCFFMRNGRICAVEFLEESEDSKRIEEAHRLFTARRETLNAEGFELWDGTRFVYRFVVDDAVQNRRAEDGLKGPGWLQRLAGIFKSRFSGLRAVPGSGLALAWPGAPAI
jgi:hypothetical protein